MFLGCRGGGILVFGFWFGDILYYLSLYENFFELVYIDICSKI